MANTYVSLPVPAGDGVGAWVDVSGIAPEKLISVDGGAFSGTLYLEGSNDAEASSFPVDCGPFVGPTFGPQEFNEPLNFMRVKRVGSSGGTLGTPSVAVGGASSTSNVFASMNVPAGDGVGAAVDLTGGGDVNSFAVVGPYGGQVFVEVSSDGVNFSPALLFDTSHGNAQTLTGVLNSARVRRRGSSGAAPLVSVGSGSNGGGGGGGGFPGFGGAPPVIAAASAAGVAGTASRSDHTHRGALENGTYIAPVTAQVSGVLQQTYAAPNASIVAFPVGNHLMPFGNATGGLQTDASITTIAPSVGNTPSVRFGALNTSTASSGLARLWIGGSATLGAPRIWIENASATIGSDVWLVGDQGLTTAVGYLSKRGSATGDGFAGDFLIGNISTGVGAPAGDTVIYTGGTNGIGQVVRFGQDGRVTLYGVGTTAAVSAAGTGSFRYNATANQLEFSNNGAAYQPFGAGLTAIANNELLGNISGGAAVPIGLTVGQVQTLLGIQPSNNVSITGGTISGTTINLLGAFATGVLGVVTGTGQLTTLALVGLHMTAPGSVQTLNNDVVTGKPSSGATQWIGVDGANGNVNIKATSSATVATAYVSIGSAQNFIVNDAGSITVAGGSLPGAYVDILGNGSLSAIRMSAAVQDFITKQNGGLVVRVIGAGNDYEEWTNNILRRAVTGAGIHSWYTDATHPTMTWTPTTKQLVVGDGVTLSTNTGSLLVNSGNNGQSIGGGVTAGIYVADSFGAAAASVAVDDYFFGQALVGYSNLNFANLAVGAATGHALTLSYLMDRVGGHTDSFVLDGTTGAIGMGAAVGGKFALQTIVAAGGNAGDVMLGYSGAVHGDTHGFPYVPTVTVALSGTLAQPFGAGLAAIGYDTNHQFWSVYDPTGAEWLGVPMFTTTLAGGAGAGVLTNLPAGFGTTAKYWNFTTPAGTNVVIPYFTNP